MPKIENPQYITSDNIPLSQKDLEEKVQECILNDAKAKAFTCDQNQQNNGFKETTPPANEVCENIKKGYEYQAVINTEDRTISYSIVYPTITTAI
mgnify:CR=1 FL=1